GAYEVIPRDPQLVEAEKKRLLDHLAEMAKGEKEDPILNGKVRIDAEGYVYVEDNETSLKHPSLAVYNHRGMQFDEKGRMKYSENKLVKISPEFFAKMKESARSRYHQLSSEDALLLRVLNAMTSASDVYLRDVLAGNVKDYTNAPCRILIYIKSDPVKV